jgi:hypothetical protein
MGRIKILLVACLTLAVATLPAAESFGPLASANASDEAVNVHCAEHARSAHPQDEQQSKHESGKDTGNVTSHCTDDGCCGKCLCLGTTSVLDRTSNVRVSSLPLPSEGRATVNLIGLTYVPQPPPPRV